MINQSYDEGAFPDRLVTAKIKPILEKGGKSCEPSSYRPIALLSAVCEVLEKLVTNHISFVCLLAVPL